MYVKLKAKKATDVGTTRLWQVSVEQWVSVHNLQPLGWSQDAGFAFIHKERITTPSLSVYYEE